MNKLTKVKLFHTIIWVIEALSIFYLLYTGLFGIINTIVYIALGLVILEGFILLYFKWRCPLTIIAEGMTNNNEVGFDIYLPKWLAKHNKTIFTIIFGIAVIAHIIQFII